MAAIAHRPEIDGLRAIAVGTVVAHHAGLGWLGGGFIGVDVFFVISGFLITSIIAGEIERGSFSLLGFYERRVRRILPALLVVVAATLAFGAWRMTPDDLVALARSAGAALGFFSNLHFASAAGYFMPAAETMPLLHTWSLGVEEQFYIVAPLLLMLAMRRRKWLAPSVWSLVALALVAAVVGTAHNADTAFYLPHTRAIELLVGVVLALGLVPAIRGAGPRNLAAGLGLAMIGWAAFGYSSQTPFPGYAALLPCVGTGLVIHATAAGHVDILAGRMLATSPMVALGKISYSLYLWHWPLLAFARYEWGMLGPLTIAGIVAASVWLAAATYWLVEQPARRARGRWTQGRVFALGAAGTLALVAAAGVLDLTRGWPGRLDPRARALAEETRHDPRIAAVCGRTGLRGALERCRVGAEGVASDALVWGDSHAINAMPLLHEVAFRSGRALLVVGRGGCPPLLELAGREHEAHRKCRGEADRIQRLLASHELHDVVLMARWSAHFTGPPTDGIVPGNIGRGNDEAAFTARFRRTLAVLATPGRRVVLVGPVPELPVGLAAAMTKAVMRGERLGLDVPVANFRQRNAIVLRLLGEAERMAGVTVIYPHEQLCDDVRCRIIDADWPLYRDDNHLNPRGLARLEGLFAAVLASRERRRADDKNR